MFILVAHGYSLLTLLYVSICHRNYRNVGLITLCWPSQNVLQCDGYDIGKDYCPKLSHSPSPLWTESVTSVKVFVRLAQEY